MINSAFCVALLASSARAQSSKILYGLDYYGGIYEVNSDNGEAVKISPYGPAPAVNFAGMAYDRSSKLIYAVQPSSGLWTIDPATWKYEGVGNLPFSPISLAFNNQDELFGVGVYDDFRIWKIDKVNATAVLLGYANGIRALAYDYLAERLLGSSLYFIDPSHNGSDIWQIDEQNGSLAYVASFENIFAEELAHDPDANSLIVVSQTGTDSSYLNIAYLETGLVVPKPNTTKFLRGIGFVPTPNSISASFPPNFAIDARQPSSLDGSGVIGWQEIKLTYEVPISLLMPLDFTVSETSGDGIPPNIQSVTRDGDERVTVVFDEPIEPGAWTTLHHGFIGAGIAVGYLPGDVNDDGVSTATDILSLIDTINGLIPRPLHLVDVDRSGQVGAPDIIRVIDLLNGAAAFDPWLGRSLPAP